MNARTYQLRVTVEHDHWQATLHTVPAGTSPPGTPGDAQTFTSPLALLEWLERDLQDPSTRPGLK
ncbi:hypothetical protein GCM10008939_20920 [Deinococcus aquiradiocola]|uniref:Uncharacterized protein n=2 Tax=Deinococcus aquiradiocola TaxID=393059 RepID=A0A917PGB6_9DEIO|nr:hypothetical protein GCM10008939_20920 [Deinococcus aquiradiocola]